MRAIIVAYYDAEDVGERVEYVSQLVPYGRYEQAQAFLLNVIWETSEEDVWQAAFRAMPPASRSQLAQALREGAHPTFARRATFARRLAQTASTEEEARPLGDILLDRDAPRSLRLAVMEGFLASGSAMESQRELLFAVYSGARDYRRAATADTPDPLAKELARFWSTLALMRGWVPDFDILGDARRVSGYSGLARSSAVVDSVIREAESPDAPPEGIGRFPLTMWEGVFSAMRAWGMYLLFTAWPFLLVSVLWRRNQAWARQRGALRFLAISGAFLLVVSVVGVPVVLPALLASPALGLLAGACLRFSHLGFRRWFAFCALLVLLGACALVGGCYHFFTRGTCCSDLTERARDCARETALDVSKDVERGQPFRTAIAASLPQPFGDGNPATPDMDLADPLPLRTRWPIHLVAWQTRPSEAGTTGDSFGIGVDWLVVGRFVVMSDGSVRFLLERDFQRLRSEADTARAWAYVGTESMPKQKFGRLSLWELLDLYDHYRAGNRANFEKALKLRTRRGQTQTSWGTIEFEVLGRLREAYASEGRWLRLDDHRHSVAMMCGEHGITVESVLPPATAEHLAQLAEVLARSKQRNAAPTRDSVVRALSSEEIALVIRHYREGGEVEREHALAILALNHSRDINAFILSVLANGTDEQKWRLRGALLDDATALRARVLQMILVRGAGDPKVAAAIERDLNHLPPPKPERVLWEELVSDETTPPYLRRSIEGAFQRRDSLNHLR